MNAFLTYCDRRTGKLRTDRIYAHRFLDWSYNTIPGWFLTDFLLSRRWISRLYGWVHRQRWTRKKIEPFAKMMNVNLEESLRPIEAFNSFNDFITREIDLSKRPMVPAPEVCISPTDGRMLVYPCVEAHTTFLIKKSQFDLVKLLCDQGLSEQFSGGSLIISRLYLSDYHHFHFPVSGTPHPAISIPGKYYAVSPYARSRVVSFFGENHRNVTLFDSDHFGQMAIVEIGAFTVGSIQQRYQPGEHVIKGDRKGLFELGGSVVVLLFKQGMIQLDEDLCHNTEAGIETYIQLGESIGTSPRSLTRR
jgi:phosphatidylserine decarboxylase